MRRYLILIALLVQLGVFTAVSAKDADGPNLTVELIAGHREAVPGTTVPIAIRFRFAPHWHAFWLNPGNTGFPARFTWKMPDGIDAPTDLRWPTPDKFLAIGGASLIDDTGASESQAPSSESPFGPFELKGPGGASLPPTSSPGDTGPTQIGFGYHEDFVMLTELVIPTDYAGDTLTVDLSMMMQICQEVCVLASPKATLTLPVVAAGSQVDHTSEDLFRGAERAMPVSITAWAPSASVSERAVTLRFTPPAGAPTLAQMVFLPATNGVYVIDAEQVLTRDGDDYVLTIPLVGDAPERVTGVVVADRAWQDGGNRGLQVDVATGAVAAVGGPATEDQVRMMGGDVSSLWGAIFFGFLGGLILNLLPCVLPILSIKILSFVEQAKDDKTSPLTHGIAYAVGVIATFIGLAVVLVALRAGAESVGWGFQQQSAPFTLVIIFVFFVFAMNLFGVFEMGNSLTSLGRLGGGGLLGSFVTGLLAVLVATPCTGPFMGTAITWSLKQPTGVVIAVFLALGIGMALPYVVLTASPRLLRLIPKPGEWMVTLKQFFGFLLMLSLVWFLYPLRKIASYETVMWTLVAMVLIGIGLWLVGRWSSPMNRPRKRVAGWVTCLALTVIAVVLVTNSLKPKPEWREWSPEAVAAARAEGRIVFIDYTADWCANCKINELVAFNDEVEERFAELEAVTFIADWTSYDPRIFDALAEFNRSGIPVYVIYSPNGTVTVIDGLIQPRDILDALDVAAADAPSD